MYKSFKNLFLAQLEAIIEHLIIPVIKFYNLEKMSIKILEGVTKTLYQGFFHGTFAENDMFDIIIQKLETMFSNQIIKNIFRLLQNNFEFEYKTGTKIEFGEHFSNLNGQQKALVDVRVQEFLDDCKSVSQLLTSA